MKLFKAKRYTISDRVFNVGNVLVMILLAIITLTWVSSIFSLTV